MNKQINNNSDYKAEALKIVKTDFNKTLPYMIINWVIMYIAMSPIFYLLDKYCV